MRLPCVYGDLAGTSWYNRLIAAEYDIRLDHYPERETLLDSRCPLELRTGRRWNEYRKVLLTLLSHPDKENMTPLDFLLLFRKARRRIFPEIPREEPLLQDSQSCTGYPNHGWSSFVSNALKSDSIISKAPDEGFRNLMEKAEKIVFIPSGSKKVNLDMDRYLYPWRGKKWEVLVSDNPDLDLPAPSDLSTAPFDLKPVNLSGIEKIPDLFDSRAVILCCHPWLLYPLLETDREFCLITDNREWYIKAFLKCSSNKSGEICYPEVSQYGEMLNLRPERPDYGLYFFTASDFPEVGDSGHVEPEFIPPTERPVWIKNPGKQNGVTFSEGFWKYKGLWKHSSSPETGAVHASLLSVSEKQVEIAPYIPDRMTSPLELESEDPLFISSFNYYFTNNLKARYRQTGNKLENWENFLIDSLGFYSKRHRRFIQSPPLYNKAFLGLTKEGRLYGFHDTIRALSWNQEERDTSRRRPQINPEGNPSEAVYLPSSSFEAAGENRDCALVIQDTVISVQKGPVGIPPFGLVIVSENLPERGYPVNWHMEWENPPVPQENWAWLYGGFNLLIEKGKNLYATPASATSALDKEGWSLPSSRETQETDLTAGVRQPRAVIGRTESGNIFLAVFSGRSRLSRGASFEECASLAMEYNRDDPLEFLLNLDGGASASLTAILGKEKQILSYPAPSDSNPPGIPRMVPAMLTIKKRKYKE